jgi:hypothetical protein
MVALFPQRATYYEDKPDGTRGDHEFPLGLWMCFLPWANEIRAQGNKLFWTAFKNRCGEGVYNMQRFPSTYMYRSSVGIFTVVTRPGLLNVYLESFGSAPSKQHT